MPQTLDELRQHVMPNLPWADEHFDERVSRVPSNPGEAYKNWPWWRGQNDSSMSAAGRFTHTYQERIWPREGGYINIPEHVKEQSKSRTPGRRGIWYEYGDLDDVVNLLYGRPYTRQAYLPIFFPEDTGAVHGGRIPCTLGYQFLLRNNKFHCFYTIRSCDMVRHFRDDVYLAVRLAMWVLNQMLERELRTDDPQRWVDVDMGDFYFTAHSFHYHQGDEQHVQS